MLFYQSYASLDLLFLLIKRTGMPKLESAFKDVRRIKTRTARNLVVRNAIRQLRKSLTKAEGKEAAELLSKLQKTLDKAAKTYVIHKNKASRLKSRLAKKLAKAKK